MISQGTTAGGMPYALESNYESNFNPAQKNGAESVFACQASVNDGSSISTNGGDGDTGDELNFPYNNGPGCCGFNNPSWNLVQAYKTDATGLPYLDGSYNNTPLINAPVKPMDRHHGSPARLGGWQTRRALFRLGNHRFYLGSRPDQ